MAFISKTELWKQRHIGVGTVDNQGSTALIVTYIVNGKSHYDVVAVILLPLKNSKAVKKSAALKSLGEKSCEIKGGGQEMAAMRKVISLLCSRYHLCSRDITLLIVLLLCTTPACFSTFYQCAAIYGSYSS